MHFSSIAQRENEKFIEPFLDGKHWRWCDELRWWLMPSIDSIRISSNRFQLKTYRHRYGKHQNDQSRRQSNESCTIRFRFKEFDRPMRERAECIRSFFIYTWTNVSTVNLIFIIIFSVNSQGFLRSQSWNSQTLEIIRSSSCRIR